MVRATRQHPVRRPNAPRVAPESPPRHAMSTQNHAGGAKHALLIRYGSGLEMEPRGEAGQSVSPHFGYRLRVRAERRRHARVGASPTWRIASAGSNRSSHGAMKWPGLRIAGHKRVTVQYSPERSASKISFRSVSRVSRRRDLLRSRCLCRVRAQRRDGPLATEYPNPEGAEGSA
jgi:hypothetical protein